MKGDVSAQISPSRVRDGDEGVAGKNGREQCFPNEGSLICPTGNFSHKKETEKVESLSRPGGHANVESDVALGLVDLLLRLLPFPLGN